MYYFSDLNLVQHKLQEVLEKCPKSLQTVNVLKPPWLNLKNRCSPVKVKRDDSVSGQLREEEKLVTLDIKNYGMKEPYFFLEGKCASQEFWIKTQTSLKNVKLAYCVFITFSFQTFPISLQLYLKDQLAQLSQFRD